MTTQDPAPSADNLDVPASVAPPAPGPALMAAVDNLKPVRTRSPVVTLLLVLGAGALAPIASLLIKQHLRPDLPDLPAAWVAGMALAWSAALVVTLLSATMPRAKQVLPNTARAGRAALLSAIVMLGLCVFATVDAPGNTIIPDQDFASFGKGWWHCTRFSLEATLPLLLVAGFAMRRLFPMGSVAVAASLGAAGGAIAGLALHFTCPMGGALHVGSAHAGGVALGAFLGMLILPRLIRQ